MNLLKALGFILLVYGVNLSEIKVIKGTQFHQQNQQIDSINSGTSHQIHGTLIPIEYFHQKSIPNVPTIRPLEEKELSQVLQTDPLLATLVLSYNLHLTPKPIGYNHPQHLPINPYVSLLLSHYGRYVPAQGHNRGIYGYAAANNYLNNLPFGSYKLYEDVDV